MRPVYAGAIGRATADLCLPRRHDAGEKRHLLRVVRGFNRGWARGPSLRGSLAEFQGHKEPASRVGEMIFTPNPTGEQVEMFTGMTQMLLD